MNKTYKAQYYVEKFPLYLRGEFSDILSELFKPIELFTAELEKINITLKSLFNNVQDNSIIKYIINNNKEQNQLVFFYTNLKIHTPDIKLKNLIGYQLLLQILLNTNLTSQFNGTRILHLFDLTYLIKIEIITTPKLLLATELDAVTKYIFQNIIKIPLVETVEEFTPDPTLRDKFRFKLPLFDREEANFKVSYDNAYFNQDGLKYAVGGEDDFYDI